MAISRKISDLLKAAHLRITQSAKHTNHSSQVVNVNILVDSDVTLKRLTAEVLDLSVQTKNGFQAITEFLQNIDAGRLDPIEKELAIVWLRKVVAANHINFSSHFAGRSRFQLVMFDTSLFDQPAGSWLEHPDFRRVVDFDGRLARAKDRDGCPQAVFRLFFVPDSKFLTENFNYVLQTIRDQVYQGITCAVGRADYLSIKDSRFVCDLFIVRDLLVCVITKPWWQFHIVEDAAQVREYFDMFDAVLKTDFVVVFDQNNKLQIRSLLRELAVI